MDFLRRHNKEKYINFMTEVVYKLKKTCKRGWECYGTDGQTGTKDPMLNSSVMTK
jgi:hypothetical protein